MAEWIKVVIQGFVQGFTEFLPVSSTGHLLVFSALLDFEQTTSGTFEIFIQIGTLVAVIWYFRQSLWQQVTTVHRDPEVRHLWLMIVVASLPIGVLGFLFLDIITDTIFPTHIAPSVIAITLIAGGLIFLIVEFGDTGDDVKKTTHLGSITISQAAMVGLIQAFALIPGTSRSGASIIGALLVGMDRPTATTFSFYLSIPALGGATVLELVTNLSVLDRSELFNLLLGAFVSGVVGWLSVVWLLRFVANHNFVIFGYYRIISGVVLIVMIMSGIL